MSNQEIQYAAEITYRDGKKYYTGVNSILSGYAEELGYPVKIVQISGHCMYATIHYFAHRPDQGALKYGPVKINGEAPDLSVVATEEESDKFKCALKQEKN